MKKLICLIFIGVFLFGAEYGRIRGRVIDSESGEPLVGADVILEGTELGAATDEKGEYTVLYVPVGTYQVVSSYISYDPFSYTSVVVNADQTTMLDFRLRPTVIQMEQITVAAERPLVVVSQTDTRRAVTSAEMNRLPVTTINQVITLQAGVSESDRGTHLRGGRATCRPAAEAAGCQIGRGHAPRRQDTNRVDPHPLRSVCDGGRQPFRMGEGRRVSTAHGIP